MIETSPRGKWKGKKQILTLGGSQTVTTLYEPRHWNLIRKMSIRNG